MAKCNWLPGGRRGAFALGAAAAASLMAAWPAWAGQGGADEGRVLRVCADPDNMPFSNARGEGFENRIAALLAQEIHAELETTWRTSRRGFLRRTLQSGACDVVMGVLAGAPSVAPTKPYYRSTYVAVSRRAAALSFGSYDEPSLRKLRIGLPAVGADGANTPPADALARRGIADNVYGYVNYSDGSPNDGPSHIVDAVANGEIDVAFVWGPVGGYFAKAHQDELTVAPAPSDLAHVESAFAYDIAIGVAKDETALRDELDGALARRRQDLSAILKDYGVPIVGGESDAGARAASASAN